MICDSKPCKNNGLCLEDFSTQTYTCDCTYTSFQGEKCEDGTFSIVLYKDLKTGNDNLNLYSFLLYT